MVNVHLPGVGSVAIGLSNIYVAFTDPAGTENCTGALRGAVIKLVTGQRHRLLHKTDHEGAYARKRGDLCETCSGRSDVARGSSFTFEKVLLGRHEEEKLILSRFDRGATLTKTRYWNRPSDGEPVYRIFEELLVSKVNLICRPRIKLLTLDVREETAVIRVST